MKTTILANLRKAHEILRAAPEKLFDLEYFKEQKTCGTLHCAAGWLAASPEFSDRMQFYQRMHGVWCVVEPGRDPGDWSNWKWVDKHFGPLAFDNLFATRGAGKRDHLHPQAEEQGHDDVIFPPEVTDKELALWRIEQQIAAIEGEQA
jgi:hypothetical protein